MQEALGDGRITVAVGLLVMVGLTVLVKVMVAVGGMV